LNIGNFFSVAFIAGAVMGVFVMLVGVVRPLGKTVPELPVGTGPFVSRERLKAAAGRLSARYHLPVLAAFTLFFGLVGYTLSRYTQLGAVTQLAIAGVAGGGMAVFAATFVAKWALPAARRDIPDERFVLQGHFARVLKEITERGPGLVAVEINGVSHTAPALSVIGERIAEGTDVVIERIEGSVAFVEPWAVVERRI
jgi:membrane protein implicated in regulation of membrane protease activity